MADNGIIAGFKFSVSDGGHVAIQGTKFDNRDCVVRAISIATDTPYTDVSKKLIASRKASGQYSSSKESDCQSGNRQSVYGPMLEKMGWRYVQIGKTGSRLDKISLNKNGRYMLKTKRHLVAVIDGEFQDTWDSRRNSRDGKSDDANVEDFGNTDIPSALRPKPVTVKGYWVKEGA